ncbi:hypothetical protein AKO1_000940, partial [Acrasis kona]
FWLETSGIRPNVTKLANMLEWERPSTKKKLQRYLGIVNFFRRFIPKASHKLCPLLRAASLEDKPNSPIVWTNDFELIYKQIFADLITNVPFLHFASPSVPLELATDASDDAVGGCLFQIINGKTHYLGFHSRVLRGSERNYAIPKKELFSAILHINYYRHHLHGKYFRLHLDNEAITKVFKTGPSDKHDRTIAGWIATLAEYHFDAYHINGIDNILPDLLSRVQSASCTINQLSVVNATLTSKPDKSPLSEEDINTILTDAHSIGHFGASTMHNHIYVTQEITNIPNLLQLCLEYCKQCPVCRKINNYRIGFSPLHYPNFMVPMQTLHCDLFAMSTSKRGHKYVLQVIDEFSRFTWLSACVSKKVEEVGKRLLSICASYGFPHALKSDNGGEFCGSLVRILNKAMNIQHKTIVAHDHHANGLIERNNRTARDTLIKLTNDASNDITEWDHFVDITMLHLNSKIHSSVASSPFGLMFGRSPFSAGGDILRYTKEQQDQAVVQWLDFWTTFKRDVIPHILQLKKKKFNHIKPKYSKIIDQFNVGEYVMWRIPNPSDKTSDRYAGPFKIESVDAHNIYEIKSEVQTLHAPANFLNRISLKSGETLLSHQVNDKGIIHTEIAEESEVGIDDLSDPTVIIPPSPIVNNNNLTNDIINESISVDHQSLVESSPTPVDDLIAPTNPTLDHSSIPSTTGTRKRKKVPAPSAPRRSTRTRKPYSKYQ